MIYLSETKKLFSNQEEFKNMIKKYDTQHENIIAFQFAGNVERQEFEEVIVPEVTNQIVKVDKINLVYVLDTSVSNFTSGAWWEDAMMGLKNLSKFSRSAIVTDSEMIKNFTAIFSIVMPGEFKGFDCDNMEYAMDWAAGG